MLFLDTVVLAGLTHPLKRSLPPSNPDPGDAAEEWKWIESSLDSSTADWILVCGHYPGITYPSTNHMLFCALLVSLVSVLFGTCSGNLWHIQKLTYRVVL